MKSFLQAIADRTLGDRRPFWDLGRVWQGSWECGWGSSRLIGRCTIGFCLASGCGVCPFFFGLRRFMWHSGKASSCSSMCSMMLVWLSAIDLAAYVDVMREVDATPTGGESESRGLAYSFHSSRACEIAIL